MENPRHSIESSSIVDSHYYNKTRGDSLIMNNQNDNLHKHTHSHNITKKEQNFYQALSLIQKLTNQSMQYDNISEFSEANVDESKENNINFYIKRPIIKEIIKKGNNIYKIHPHINYSRGVNSPYVNDINLKGILKHFLPNIIEVEENEDEKEIEEVKAKTKRIFKFSNKKEKKSTTALTQRSQREKDEYESKDIQPFELEPIDDLDEDKNIDIDYYNNNQKSFEELMVIDTIFEISSGKRIDIERNLYSKSFKIDLNSQIRSIDKNNTTNEKKLRLKFTKSKLKEENKKINNELENSSLISVVVNKNLLAQFNICSNNNTSKNNNITNSYDNNNNTASIKKNLFISIDNIKANITPIKGTTKKNYVDQYKTPKSKKKHFDIYTHLKYKALQRQNILKDISKSDSLDLSLSSSHSYSNNNRFFLHTKNTPSRRSLSQYNNQIENQCGTQTIYDIDFYNNLLETYSKNPKASTVTANFIENHPDLSWDNRAVLIDWMNELCEEFAFKRDTFHYSVCYLDKYLEKSYNISKNELQLIGVTCINIAGKIEEVEIPKISEYAGLLDENYTIKEIMERERIILSVLKWRIVPITISTWLNWYLCQWDLFIDTVDDVKDSLLKLFSEEELLYFKRSDNRSYYNYRRITQLMDIIVTDYNSLNHNDRFLIAALILIIIHINFNIDSFDYCVLKYSKENEKIKILWSTYINFLSQSFDIDINQKEIQNAIKYCGSFINLKFSYELPLYYQVEGNEINNQLYEDFVSYQTYNNGNIDYLKSIYY